MTTLASISLFFKYAAFLIAIFAAKVGVGIAGSGLLGTLLSILLFCVLHGIFFGLPIFIGIVIVRGLYKVFTE